MEICVECGRPIHSLKELKESLGKPYLQAISDKAFLEALERREKE